MTPQEIKTHHQEILAWHTSSSKEEPVIPNTPAQNNLSKTQRALQLLEALTQNFPPKTVETKLLLDGINGSKERLENQAETEKQDALDTEVEPIIKEISPILQKKRDQLLSSNIRCRFETSPWDEKKTFAKLHINEVKQSIWTSRQGTHHPHFFLSIRRKKATAELVLSTGQRALGKTITHSKTPFHKESAEEQIEAALAELLTWGKIKPGSGLR